MFSWKTLLFQEFLTKAIYLKACFTNSAESDLFRHFSVTFLSLSVTFLTGLGWFNEGSGTVLFPSEKCGKQSLFSGGILKNSTTGCGDLSSGLESDQKVTKRVTFPSLSEQSQPLLTISMGKSLPFWQSRKRRFLRSWRKQSI